MFLFIGKEVAPETLGDIFGYKNLTTIPISFELPALDTTHSKHLRAAISQIRSRCPRFLNLNICRQGIDTQTEARFANLLIEDSNFDGPTYPDYVVSVHRAIEKEIAEKR